MHKRPRRGHARPNPVCLRLLQALGSLGNHSGHLTSALLNQQRGRHVNGGDGGAVRYAPCAMFAVSVRRGPR